MIKLHFFIINNLRLKNKYKIIGLILLFIISLFLYIIRPAKVTMTFNYFCFINFLISTYIYFSCKRKTNYFDFDTIFILLYSIVGFAYPIFIYDKKYPFEIFFNMHFDVNFISTGVILFLIGIQSYFLGSLLAKRSVPNISNIKYINNRFLVFIVLMLSIAFILSGGVQYYQASYLKNNLQESGFTMQILVLLQAFSMTAIATEFYNKIVVKTHKLNILLLFSLLWIVLLMLYAGNRTFASQLALPIIGLYALFFKNIGKVKFLLLMFMGIFLMWIIQYSRVGREIDSLTSYAAIISDLTFTTRSTYTCLEYVDKYGYSYGLNMLGGLIGIIPSIGTLFIQFLGIDPRTLGSAETLTRFSLGDNPTFGLGTNIIADIYLSFGFIGVIIFMYFLGGFVNRHLFRANKLNYYSLIIYTVMISYSVFLVRTTYTHPVKIIVWSLIIARLNMIFTRKYAIESK